MREQVTGGAAVIDSLVAHGVRDVFGIPGTHNLELYRYLPASDIRHVVTRHEQGAGYAADGYARVGGRPGVFITTSGPGITNAVTALATSYADSVPTLAVSPGPPRGTVGADVGWLHEVKNQQAALEAVCGRSIRVEHADEIPEVVAAIFEQFATGRPRPIHLEIPVDVLEGEWNRRPAPVRSLPAPVRPGRAAIEAIAVAIAAANRPVVLAGGGARRAAGEIRAMAEYGIPVLTTVNGKGVLDERHPAALGAAVRLKAARDVADEADVLLIVGSEVGDADLWGGTLRPGVTGERMVIRIDLDPAQMHKNVQADLAIVGDASAVLGDVLEVLRDKGIGPRPVEPLQAHRDAIAAAADRDAGPWKPIQRALAAALPADTVVAGDSSQVTYYGTVHHWPFTPANRLLYPTGYATLGYGLPAAIGAKLAAPDRPVIGLFGDGAAMFSIQELITATEQRLALPIVIVDNGGYAEIREQMVERGITPQAVDLYRPDIPALARAIGAHGVVATTADDIARLASQALTADRPTVIHHQVG
ncbi:thiamine pyrophosphate-binding protein [Micromonospora soli]|uniref:thiamine pyrophosphate-binding protein n=1 Tax=Micromonospora sp. NBRC 110009 TaxID=3061627 RepID=UPI002671D8F8|nr:thiamine pyrophosphate-binding protein [Micromonospora sp. NBRC 110009]WKT96931.1 thiamine pyrophosphate-binding protein [Micromonospora sp. NBRC 110009]